MSNARHVQHAVGVEPEDLVAIGRRRDACRAFAAQLARVDTGFQDGTQLGQAGRDAAAEPEQRALGDLFEQLRPGGAVDRAVAAAAAAEQR